MATLLGAFTCAQCFMRVCPFMPTMPASMSIPCFDSRRGCQFAGRMSLVLRTPFDTDTDTGFQHSVAAEFRSLRGPAGCIRARGLFDLGLPPTPCVWRGESARAMSVPWVRIGRRSRSSTPDSRHVVSRLFLDPPKHSNSAKPAAGSSLHSSRVALLASHPPTGASLSCSQ